MKKYIALLILISIVITAFGCGNKAGNDAYTATFYYRALELQFGSTEAVVVSEKRNIQHFNNDLTQILEYYFNGPKESNHTNPYPAGTTLEQFTLGNDRAYIVLSSHLSLLTGADLTIACACITKTVTELADVHSVEISTKNGTLNGSPSLIMTAKDFAYWETYLKSLNNR